MKTTTILNVLARASIGVTSTLVGMRVGKKVAESHNTVTASAAASAATLITYVTATELFTDIQYMISKKSPDEDQVATLFEDEFEDELVSDDEHTSNETPDLFSNYSSSDNVDTTDSETDDNESVDTTASDDDEPADTATSSVKPVDDAASDNTTEDSASNEDPIKADAMAFLEKAGGDPTMAKRGLNAALLNECLDSLLKNPELYKTIVSEDEDDDDKVVYLSGHAVELIDAIASVALIKPSGRCDYEAHDELRRLSEGRYFVTPGEVDSFGWLTGVINTPVGIIVYG